MFCGLLFFTPVGPSCLCVTLFAVFVMLARCREIVACYVCVEFRRQSFLGRNTVHSTVGNLAKLVLLHTALWRVGE